MNGNESDDALTAALAEAFAPDVTASTATSDEYDVVSTARPLNDTFSSPARVEAIVDQDVTVTTEAQPAAQDVTVGSAAPDVAVRTEPRAAAQPRPAAPVVAVRTERRPAAQPRSSAQPRQAARDDAYGHDNPTGGVEVTEKKSEPGPKEIVSAFNTYCRYLMRHEAQTLGQLTTLKEQFLVGQELLQVEKQNRLINDQGGIDLRPATLENGVRHFHRICHQ